MPEVRRFWHALLRTWSGACLIALIVLIGARWIRYTSWSEQPSVDRLVRRMMVVDAQAFLWLWAYTQRELPTILLAIAVVVVALHRRLPARLVVHADGAWRLTPLAMALVLSAMLWLHYAFDVNPTVAAACGTSLLLLWCLGNRRVAALLPRVAVVAAWAVFFAGWLLAAGDAFDRLAIVAWAGVLLIAQQLLAARVGGVELALLLTVAVAAMNVLAAILPLAVAPSGATYLGTGLAYSFCEVPNRGTVYATIPVCGSVQHDGYEECRDGRIVEYDLASKRPVAEHRFFSPSFYGRLELLVCLADEIEVGVQASVYQGQPMVQSAMSFSVADPSRFVPVVAGRGLGTGIAYDAARDALFYVGEFTNVLVRYDRRSGQFDDTASQDLVRPWHQPVTLEAFGNSLVIGPQSIHPGRNRLYVQEWIGGSDAYAVDLTTLRRVARYDVGSGAGFGLSVDPERDRLFVSSLWGIEVFDLATDTLITRKRIGLGNRPVVVDAVRNRLYVSSMVEGKIRILDRDTLDVIGQIPMGIGSRAAHLSRDGKYLLATSIRAHYSFDADEIGPAS